ANQNQLQNKNKKSNLDERSLDDVNANKQGRETTAKGGKIGNYDAGLVKRYFQHVEEVTGLKVHPKQVEKLKEALRAKEYTKLNKVDLDAHRLDFNTKKNSL